MSKKILATLLLSVLVIMVLVNYKTILKKFFPIQYYQEVLKYSEEYNVDPYIVYSIIRVESKFNPFAQSGKGAKGLMQITPQTGEYIAKLLNVDEYDEEQLFQPSTNIKFGVFYFSKLYKDFNNNLDCALAAYNGGRGNVLKWLDSQENGDNYLDIDNIPFEETKNYVKRVKNMYKLYGIIYK